MLPRRPWSSSCVKAEIWDEAHTDGLLHPRSCSTNTYDGYFCLLCAARSILYAWCLKCKLSFSRLLCALRCQVASACLTLGMYNEHTFASHNVFLKCENTQLRAHSCEFIAHGATCTLNSAVYDSTLCLFTVFSPRSQCLFTMNTETCFSIAWPKCYFHHCNLNMNKYSW